MTEDGTNIPEEIPKRINHTEVTALPNFPGGRPGIEIKGSELIELLKKPDLAITQVEDSITKKPATVVIEIETTNETGDIEVSLRQLGLEKLAGPTPGHTFIPNTTTVIPIDPEVTYYVDKPVHEKLQEERPSEDNPINRKIASIHRGLTDAAKAASRAAEVAAEEKALKKAQERRGLERRGRRTVEAPITAVERATQDIVETIIRHGLMDGGVLYRKFARKKTTGIQSFITQPQGITTDEWANDIKRLSSDSITPHHVDSLNKSSRGFSSNIARTRVVKLMDSLGLRMIFDKAETGQTSSTLTISLRKVGTKGIAGPHLSVQVQNI